MWSNIVNAIYESGRKPKPKIRLVLIVAREGRQISIMGSTVAADSSTALEVVIVATDSKGNVIGGVSADSITWSVDNAALGTVSPLADATKATATPVGPVGVFNVDCVVVVAGKSYTAAPYPETVVPGAPANVVPTIQTGPAS